MCLAHMSQKGVMAISSQKGVIIIMAIFVIDFETLLKTLIEGMVVVNRRNGRRADKASSVAERK